MSRHTRRHFRRLLLGLSLALLAPHSPVAASTSPLAGTWRIDTARSTDLSPWSALELAINVAGEQVTIQRRFSAGRRAFTEVIALDLDRSENLVSVPWWPDNRHLGAYAGGDQVKRVRATWHDARRILRLSSDLVLEAQQGPREVNILSDYKVFPERAILTLTELRSTRSRPVVYVFNRVGPAQP